MSGRLWLGLDVGTQSAKCVIVDEAGTVRARAASPLSSERAPGVHTQDPHQWIRAAAAVTARATSRLEAGDRSRIAGLATCSTSGTYAVVDRTGRPRGAGVVYDDRRGAEHTGIAGDLAARDDGVPRPVTSSWALPSMAESAARGDLNDGERFAHQADVIAAAIVGHAVPTDWSHALKSGYDVRGARWPVGLARLGLSEAMLPPVVSPGSLLGTVGASWAAAGGLPRGVEVYAGMTDGCAAQIGAGTVTPGDVHTVIGTTTVFKAVSTHEVDDAVSGLYSHRSPDGLWYPGAASHAGAAPLSGFEDLLDEARRRYAGRPGDIPTAYPSALEGERFPFVSPDAGGSVWDGAGRRTDLDDPGLDPVDRVASILLGLACVERLALERLSAAVDTTGGLSSSGGASSNRWLTQIRADLLGREVCVRRGGGGALGMAVLARWSRDGGGTSLADVTDRMVAAGQVQRPTADRAWAEHAYERFRRRLTEASWI